MKIDTNRIACDSNNLLVMCPSKSPRDVILEALKTIFTGEKDDIYFEPTIGDDYGIFHITYYHPGDAEYLEPQYSDIEVTRFARLDVVCRDDQDYFPYHEIRKFLIDRKLYFGQYLFYNDGQSVN